MCVKVRPVHSQRSSNRWRLWPCRLTPGTGPSIISFSGLVCRDNYMSKFRHLIPGMHACVPHVLEPHRSWCVQCTKSLMPYYDNTAVSCRYWYTVNDWSSMSRSDKKQEVEHETHAYIICLSAFVNSRMPPRWDSVRYLFSLTQHYTACPNQAQGQPFDGQGVNQWRNNHNESGQSPGFPERPAAPSF